MKRRFSLSAALLFLTLGVNTPDINAQGVNIRGGIAWDRMEMTVTVTLDLGAAGIRLPTGRSQAEEIIKVEYPSLMRPYTLAIPVDSSTTLEDLINRGEFSFLGPEEVAASARRLPPALSPDLALLSTTYTVDLSRISAQLLRHTRPMEIRRPLSPVPSASYTGIIIIANGELPVHGRKTNALVQPCLFPRLWDMDMNLLYERNILDPDYPHGATLVRYVNESSVLGDSPSGIAEDLLDLVGSRPLRIIARETYGVRPTDILIDNEDALIILSNENNRRLLRESRVAIVLSNEVLRSPLGSP